MTSRRLIYQGKVLRLSLQDNWEIIEHQDAVAVLGLRNEMILGVRQHRPAIGQDTWEVPAGLIDAGESPIDAARRELAEEAQLSGRLELISQFYSSPGFCNEKIYLYRATDLVDAEGQTDPDEDLSVVWSDLQSLWHAIREGKLASSAPSVLAIHYALQLSGFRV